MRSWAREMAGSSWISTSHRALLKMTLEDITATEGIITKHALSDVSPRNDVNKQFKGGD